MSKKENKKKYFSEFEETSKNEWLTEVRNLTGKNSSEVQFWHTPQGFSVDTYYTKDELTPIVYLADFQTYSNNGLKQLRKWEYRELIAVDSGKLKTANEEALAALASGADGIIFDLDSIDIQEFDPKFLLQNISLSKNSLSFRCQKKITKIFNELSEYLAKEQINSGKVCGTAYVDPVAHWCLTGDAYGNELDELVHCIDKIGNLPRIHFLSVRSDHFHAAGATLVQELAFLLSSAVTYLDWFTNKEANLGKFVRNIAFSVAVGSCYFMEIAKLRALKILFSKIVQAYGEQDFSTEDVPIHAIAAQRSKTIKEPYTNMVRNTSEAMAALLGGCDSLTLLPFDQAYEKSESFSQRVSRNISLLLREEAYFDKANDPVAGSYYIAQLTDKLAEHAWQLFLKVEAMGGFIDAFKQGFIQEEIERSAKERQDRLDQGKQIIIGVNKYQSEENYAELGMVKNLKVDQHKNLAYPVLTPLPKA